MRKAFLPLALAGFVALPVFAQGGAISAKQSAVLKDLIATYTVKAKEEAHKRSNHPAPMQGFSAEVGREFYLKRRTWEDHDRTCSGCHTDNPAKEGKHIETNKPIKPLAPAANPERFTDAHKVEKNFAEHCADLYSRDCRAEEKGHFITYLMSVK